MNAINSTPDTTLVARTILEQLGGRKFMAMTGARAFVGSPDALSFRLPGNAKRGINRIRVTLTDRDDYRMEFCTVRGAAICEIIETTDGIYCDKLQSVFTAVTGLHTHF